VLLGITGTIGCGKSTVSDFFREQGWIVFSADRFCHSLYEKNDKDILDFFDSRNIEVRNSESGSIDRHKTANAVFGNQSLLDELTKTVIYPKLDRALKNAISEATGKNKNFAAEIPLLYENKYEKYFDLVMTVWCSKSVRHQRLQQLRGMSIEDILRREALQMAADKKLAAADVAVINNGSIENLKSQLLYFLSLYKL
jgi:dephospho-CoA kinase